MARKKETQKRTDRPQTRSQPKRPRTEDTQNSGSDVELENDEVMQELIRQAKTVTPSQNANVTTVDKPNGSAITNYSSNATNTCSNDNANANANAKKIKIKNSSKKDIVRSSHSRYYYATEAQDVLKASVQQNFQISHQKFYMQYSPFNYNGG